MKIAVILFLLFTSVLVFSAELKLPAKISELEFFGRKDYDTAEAGYSVRYQYGELLKADVYIYHNGHKNLGNGLDSPLVAQELKSVGDGIRYIESLGKYKDVKEQSSGTRDFPSLKTKFLWSRYSYKQTPDSGATFTGSRISDTYITAYKDNFLKIRITTREADIENDQKLIDAFILEIARLIEADQ